MSYFSLAAFRILSLSLTFGVLIMMCLGVGGPLLVHLVWDLWDKFKYANIHITGGPEEEGEQRIENLYEEIMT